MDYGKWSYLFEKITQGLEPGNSDQVNLTRQLTTTPIAAQGRYFKHYF